jgi:hypothetical protein
MVAGGNSDLAILPVGEILHAAGVDFAGRIAPEIQFVQMFSAAVVAGSGEIEASKRLRPTLAIARTERIRVIECAVKSTRGAERIIPDQNMRQAGAKSCQMVDPVAKYSNPSANPHRGSVTRPRSNSKISGNCFRSAAFEEAGAAGL